MIYFFLAAFLPAATFSFSAELNFSLGAVLAGTAIFLPVCRLRACLAFEPHENNLQTSINKGISCL